MKMPKKRLAIAVKNPFKQSVQVTAEHIPENYNQTIIVPKRKRFVVSLNSLLAKGKNNV